MMNVADGIADLGQPVQPCRLRICSPCRTRSRREILDKLRPAPERRGEEAGDEALHGQRAGVSALPAGPLSLEQGHDRRLQEGDRVLPAGDRARIRGTRWPTRASPTRICCSASYWVEAITEAKSAADRGAADRSRPGRGAHRARATSSCGSTGTGRPPSASSRRASRSTRRRRWRTTSTRCTWRRWAGLPTRSPKSRTRPGARSALAHHQRRPGLVPALRRPDRRGDDAVPEDDRVRRQFGVGAPRPGRRLEPRGPARRGDRRTDAGADVVGAQPRRPRHSSAPPTRAPGGRPRPKPR